MKSEHVYEVEMSVIDTSESLLFLYPIERITSKSKI
jgi:hypothetical protein